VAIRRSSSADTEALIADLRSSAEDDARRETALARLAIIGRRAVSHILRELDGAATPDERAALLLALERIPDPRSVDAVLAALEPSSSGGGAHQAVRLAAIRVARPLLDVSPGATSLLERLTTIVLDPREPVDVRRAAFEAMADLPARTVEPLRQRLAADADPSLRLAAQGRRAAGSEPLEELTAFEQRLPADPDALLATIGRAGADAPLSTLHAILKSVREKEPAAGRRRADWLAVRGALHLVLARRDSRVALYDLREAFESPSGHPLPADFASAMELIGDGTCLEPIARAWMQAPGVAPRAGSGSWPDRLREVFRAVLQKERPAARRKVLGRLQQRWAEGAAGARLRELLEGDPQ
jgi:hypothetical protein